LFPWDPPHETYVNVYDGETIRHQDLLDHRRPNGTYYSGTRQGTLAVVRTFVLQGIHHIFIGPDHILFIVGLLLLGGSLGRLLKIVTAFTVAHSITLALATTGVLNPPSRWIEPAIALSIVYVGVETLVALGKQRDRRAAIAFVFGFIHGFGFASVLRDFGLPSGALGWSLAAFNVGVEIGQMCIVLAVAPALALLRTRRPLAARRVVSWGAACIIVAGGFWLVQRILAGA
jgi:hydrogenase/urease accessory protein HupE